MYTFVFLVYNGIHLYYFFRCFSRSHLSITFCLFFSHFSIYLFLFSIMSGIIMSNASCSRSVSVMISPSRS
nr:MAG TPA: hypothetical protein [Caudoviricetes sp.]